MQTVNKLLSTILLLLIVVVNANAQKLPNIQTAGVRAPADVKIDGKAIEWGGTFKAYNHATEIFYTLANNDDNLYLVVQATDPDIVNRVAGGGVSLFVQPSGKKDEKGSKSVTYPITDWNSPMFFKLKDEKHPDTSAKTADSVMLANNTTLKKNVKWIITVGFPGIDTLTSIFNQTGIKAAGWFDNKKVFTYEITVPLKLLGLSVNDARKFSYHIVVNGNRKIHVITPRPDATPFMIDDINQYNARNARMTQPTDFWGEYTLVK